MVEIISLLFAHFFGDWFLQSRTIAVNKSNSFYYMFLHIVLVLIPIYFVLLLYGSPEFIWIEFLFIYACFHGFQDFIIWKIFPSLLKIKNEYWKDKKFYDLIAVDQFLHLAALFILWEVFYGY